MFFCRTMHAWRCRTRHITVNMYHTSLLDTHFYIYTVTQCVKDIYIYIYTQGKIYTSADSGLPSHCKVYAEGTWNILGFHLGTNSEVEDHRMRCQLHYQSGNKTLLLSSFYVTLLYSLFGNVKIFNQPWSIHVWQNSTGLSPFAQNWQWYRDWW